MDCDLQGRNTSPFTSRLQIVVFQLPRLRPEYVTFLSYETPKILFEQQTGISHIWTIFSGKQIVFKADRIASPFHLSLTLRRTRTRTRSLADCSPHLVASIVPSTAA